MPPEDIDTLKKAVGYMAYVYDNVVRGAGYDSRILTSLHSSISSCKDAIAKMQAKFGSSSER